MGCGTARQPSDNTVARLRPLLITLALRRDGYFSRLLQQGKVQQESCDDAQVRTAPLPVTIAWAADIYKFVYMD